MSYEEIMQHAIDLYNARGAQYGAVSEGIGRAAALASLVLNREVCARDVAMILHCVKLSRIAEDPRHIDSYVDGINYLAFGLELTAQTPA